MNALSRLVRSLEAIYDDHVTAARAAGADGEAAHRAGFERVKQVGNEALAEVRFRAAIDDINAGAGFGAPRTPTHRADSSRTPARPCMTTERRTR